ATMRLPTGSARRVGEGEALTNTDIAPSLEKPSERIPAAPQPEQPETRATLSTLRLIPRIRDA
ncbi:MAG: hypothetical protein ACHQ6U_14050, partial [Thermodesulfobacteriota bacterium]